MKPCLPKLILVILIQNGGFHSKGGEFTKINPLRSKRNLQCAEITFKQERWYSTGDGRWLGVSCSWNLKGGEMDTVGEERVIQDANGRWNIYYIR